MQKLKRWRARRKLRKIYDAQENNSKSFEEWLDIAVILAGTIKRWDT